MTDGYFGFDSVVYPLPSLTDNPTPILPLGDPVYYQVCAFFSQLLNTNLMPRFANEAMACGMTHATFQNWVDNIVVAQTVAFPLTPDLLKTTDFKFPLLAVHTERTFLRQWTLTDVVTQRDLVVSWILPPLSVGQYNRLYEFFGMAEKTWVAYGPQGYDPKVDPEGPSVWQISNLSFGALREVAYLPYLGMDMKVGKDANFPSIQLKMSLVERNQRPIPQNFEPFTGIVTLQENLVDGYNPANPIDNFVDGYIYPNITLVSCLPASGSVQGNTQLVLQGTGFEPQKISLVTVCGAPAIGINVLSQTLMMVTTTPSVGGLPGTGNVVVYDQSNNAYTLVNGFTYTTP
jgi:IPT/TIG domain